MSLKPVDLAGLAASPGPDPSEMDARRMNREEAARQFESYLAQMMVKEMRATLPRVGSSVPRPRTCSPRSSTRRSPNGLPSPDASVCRRASWLVLARRLPIPEAPVPGRPESHVLFPSEVPVVGGRISSGFGRRKDPFHGEDRHHHGVDIAAPQGALIQPVRPGPSRSRGEERLRQRRGH